VAPVSKDGFLIACVEQEGVSWVGVPLAVSVVDTVVETVVLDISVTVAVWLVVCVDVSVSVILDVSVRAGNADWVTVTMEALSKMVMGEADSVMVRAEQMLGEAELAKLDGLTDVETSLDEEELAGLEMATEVGMPLDEVGASERVRILVDKVVRPIELEATCPLQVPNSFWHFFASQ
jgi:hypothetical protein